LAFSRASTAGQSHNRAPESWQKDHEPGPLHVAESGALKMLPLSEILLFSCVGGFFIGLMLAAASLLG
jgi:hypothetical protein